MNETLSKKKDMPEAWCPLGGLLNKARTDKTMERCEVSWWLKSVNRYLQRMRTDPWGTPGYEVLEQTLQISLEDMMTVSNVQAGKCVETKMGWYTVSNLADKKTEKLSWVVRPSVTAQGTVSIDCQVTFLLVPGEIWTEVLSWIVRILLTPTMQWFLFVEMLIIVASIS